MARYIDSEKITSILMDMAQASRRLYPGIMTSISQINAMPAADVQPGHWIAEIRGLYHGINLLDDKNFKGLSMYSCSECNEKVIFKGNYCPNCGAKMDGKDGEIMISKPFESDRMLVKAMLNGYAKKRRTRSHSQRFYQLC